MTDLDEDDAEACVVDRAYDAIKDTAPGPAHRIPAIDAVRAELRAAVRERDELRTEVARVNESATVAYERLESERDDAERATHVLEDRLAELRAGALLAIDAKRNGATFDYELHVGLLLNALAGKAATGMPGDGVAVVETEAA